MSYFHYDDCDDIEAHTAYEFKGGLNVPSLYHRAQHESLEKKTGIRDGIEYTFRPYACKASGLYQPRVTMNVPHRSWDDHCFIQQKERLNQEAHNYHQNLNKFRRVDAEVHPTAGVAIKYDRRQALRPGQLRSEFYLKGRGKAFNHCPGDIPSIPPDPRDRLHLPGSRKDSGFYPEQTMNRRGMVATHELNPFERIGVTPKGPPSAHYAAMHMRQGFLEDTYQAAIDEAERINDELWADQPSYY